MGARPSLSVVMPAFDEAAGIEAALVDAAEALRWLQAEEVIGAFEVLVVDDGSTDATAAVVDRHGREHPEVRLLRHDRNRGVGAGLRTGIAGASMDLLLYTDADMPVDLRVTARALPELAGDGVVLVAGHRSRYDGEPRHRRTLSHAYDRLAKVLFDVHQRDVNFPFKLLRTDLARSLDLRAEGALVDVELLRLAGAAGRVVPLELAYRPRQLGESKTMSWRLLRQLSAEMVRERRSMGTSA